ncbi:hypothetical protein BDM02DRAFT_3121076, partial [Thelephora ganbajun]
MKSSTAPRNDGGVKSDVSCEPWQWFQVPSCTLGICQGRRDHTLRRFRNTPVTSLLDTPYMLCAKFL